MGWILSGGDKRITLEPGHVIGRADFPFEPMLSRRHFEILIRDDRVFVQDLRSTNGTTLNGDALKPLVPAEMNAGDVLRVGKSEFTLYAQAEAEADSVGVFARWPPTARADAAVLALLIAATFAQPSLAFGRAVGWRGSAIILGCLLVSLLPAALLWGFVFRKVIWTTKKYLLYAAVTGLTAVFFNFVVISCADHTWAIGDDLVQSKIEYFCLNRFRHSECVRQVGLCPDCALRIDRWKRDLMLRNLKAAPQTLKK
jgi:hypothetical protein